MENKSILSVIIVFLLLTLCNTVDIEAQQDSVKIAEPPYSIRDSVLSTDSTRIKLPPKPFLVKFYEHESEYAFSSYSMSKKEIDFTDYRYSGNVISFLPFGNLSDFGSLGMPNEPLIYGAGYGNISLNVDGIFLTNRWNNSSDMNRIHTESINTLSIAPLNRGFLYGFENNLASIIIKSKDTLKSKPISRLRYYQAPNEEGFVDAFFSARVLSRMALSLRVSNSSIDNNYLNSVFGTWKVNVKGIYKLSDSLFSSVQYQHIKLNTPFNGGIDINSASFNSNGQYDIYPTTNSVILTDMLNETSINNIYADFYGKILPIGISTFKISYQQNDENLSYSADTNTVKYKNNYNLLSAQLEHDLQYEKLRGELRMGYEHIKYSAQFSEQFEERSSSYASILADYRLFNDFAKPAIYGKYNANNNEQNLGYGSDLTILPSKNVKILLGYSQFEKPYSFIESKYLPDKNDQSYEILFSTIEIQSGKIKSSISYFNSIGKNVAIPILNLNEDRDGLNDITYITDKNVKTSGMNVNASLEYWNILFTGNFNYNWSDEGLYDNSDKVTNAKAGLFYVDTLFNSNLNLKTGFILHFHDNPHFRTYDFRQMRSASYSTSNNSIQKLSFVPTINDKFRIDLYLAGRIQDTATFYLIYENLIGNTYYSVPYFPMPEGGIRIGISWDFLD